MRKGFTLVELLAVMVVIGVIGAIGFGMGYGFFSRTSFTGTVTACSGMTANGGMFNKSTAAPFSFAVDLNVPGQDEIIAFSSEDRKFANVVKGDSIKVMVSKYAPWNFAKAGGFYGGRLIKKFKTK